MPSALVTSAFDGFGCNSIGMWDGKPTVTLRPKAASRPEETHAALMLGPGTKQDLTLTCEVETVRQIRTGSAPNPHEVGWLVWNYQDNAHFYYFLVKASGWELGKRDPRYPGGQRFLATDTQYAYSVGTAHRIQVQEQGARITVAIDDQSVADITDREAPYTSGQIGFYCEDAEVRFRDVRLDEGGRASTG